MLSVVSVVRRHGIAANRCARCSVSWRSQALLRRRGFATKPGSPITILGKEYPKDEYTNVTPAILAKLGTGLLTRAGHPLCTLRETIEAHLGPSFTALTGDGKSTNTNTNATSSLNLNPDLNLSPIVSPHENFDQLSFPSTHPGRSRTDSYYLTKIHMLRTHTSAHEVALFAKGLRRYLLSADVFRRDEVDARHYPVFHQMEGARLWEARAPSEAGEIREEDAALRARLRDVGGLVDESALLDPSVENPYQPVHDPALAALVASHLRSTLSLLLVRLFAHAAGATPSAPLQIRWIPAYFPFTSPSYEAEVFFQGRWLEVLGCGVVQQATLDHANVQNQIGWAFGLGLERIAMVLFGIPDIRLFWSKDVRFLSQFKPGQIEAVFRPYSRYPASTRDLSFWTNPSPNPNPNPTGGRDGKGTGEKDEEKMGFHANDFADIVRGVAGDLVEEVELIDSFTHPKTRRHSVCFRITYRSMDRSLESGEINVLNDDITKRAVEELGVEIR